MFNAEAFIAEAIDSVRAQEYENWEMLIVDNCSTDKSRSIVSAYTEGDHRIKLITSESNSGSPARPRNIGIKDAQGKYIAFLDADDFWLKEKLTKQVNFLEQNNDVFLLYSRYLVWKNGEILNNKIAPAIHKMKAGRIFRSLFLSDNFIPCLTVIFRNRYAENYLFDENPQSMEDFDLWLKISKNEIVSYIDEPLAVYRVHGKSTTADIRVFLSKYLTLLRKWRNKVPFPMMCARYFLLFFQVSHFVLRKAKDSLVGY